MKLIKNFFKEHSFPMLLMILMNLSIIITIEWLWRKDISQMSTWITSEFPLVMMNLALLLLITIGLSFITRKYSIAYVIVLNIVLLLGLANAKKIALRNVPLISADFHLIDEAINLVPEFANKRTIILLITALIIMVGLSIFIIKGAKKFQPFNKMQMLPLIIFAIFTLSIGSISYGNNTDIMKTGLMVSLLNDVRHGDNAIQYDDISEEDLITYRPDDSTLDVSIDVDDSTVKKPFGSGLFASDEKPNVIVIQSEAFWDPNKLNLTLSENPLKTFNALEEEAVHGYMYVPVIGGGTSNTEFEILTGMTLKNYQFDSYVVFANDLWTPSSSLASIFRYNGYYAVGTHPYHGWYYRRHEVYNNLGFNEFKSMEFMENLTKLSSYVDDAYTTSEIIHNLEAHDEPIFNMVVTMQNHACFDDNRFKEEEKVIKMEEQFEPLTQKFLDTYINGVYYTDLQLRRLIDYLKDSDEPTILLFYGDHLPHLGDNYQTFRETGYLDSDELLVNENLDMMSTPFILWSNFSNENVDLGTINASYLPAILLNEMNIERPEYMKNLYQLYKTFPLFTRGFIWDVEGNKSTSKNENYEKLMKTFYYLSTIKDDLSNPDSKPWIIEDNADFNKDYDMTKVSKDK